MCSRGSPSSDAQRAADIVRASSNRLAVRSAMNSAVFSTPNSSGKMPWEWSS